MIGTCSGRFGCGGEFRGKQEHCVACHQTFATTRAGDDHETGDHNRHPWQPGGRRCRTPEEMRAVGLWQDRRGVWHGKAAKDGHQDRRTHPAPHRHWANAARHADEGV